MQSILEVGSEQLQEFWFMNNHSYSSFCATAEGEYKSYSILKILKLTKRKENKR